MIQVVTSLATPSNAGEAASTLEASCRDNPFAAEPRLLRAQLHMQAHEWPAAQTWAEEALELFCQWGTCWDKRMGYDAWVAWCRVVLQGACDQKWPTTAFGMLNLGLVEDGALRQ